ncbi:ral guanine nucleotide dissociation stimulator-like 1 isoform X2 [Megalops cyprinoides]|uniref:ral guanine nucleotide dissociation stimulator-like 1 isoform X2 n=1 Tax=Megalops cyprinoides TaxID=118141 RepID=UPI0018647019|nr:ral guanine nucleotide dissociation stimulator-like 1 isoform X2 [Megalops cyprinoides]
MGKWELTMDPVQEWGEEVEEGAVYGITLRREPVHPHSDPAEAMLELSFVQYRTCKVRRLKAATLDRLVAHLLEPCNQEPDYTRIFLSMHRTFTSTHTLIQLLFKRDDNLSDVDNSDFYVRVLLPLIQTWLDEHSEDFLEPPQYPSLQMLSFHLHRHLCFRLLAQRTETLLKKFQHEETDHHDKATSAEPSEEEEEESGDDGLECDRAEADFMAFTATDIAVELKRLDAELFIKVMPFQCLGCVWSQRDKKDSLSPTVRATIAQFNSITNRVITSLLCHPAPSHTPTLPRSPAQRACIIEKWIKVAQECRQLKNFSSLKAILSALQSNAIYRLRKTWAAVSRESMAMFEHLCDTFPDENCVLSSREILVEDGSHPAVDSSVPKSPKPPKRSPISRQTSISGGIVPYLGTYLTVLTMLDTALPDTMEGGLINFEKRRREFEVLSQIQQLQEACSLSILPHHPQITQWLLGQKMLNDQESYDLSRELEPPADSCPSSPSSWSHRLLSKKLSSLLTITGGPDRKMHSDQVSVSSSGSSGSEMEDLSTPHSSPLSLQSLSSSCHNMAEALPTSSSGCMTPSSSSSNSQPDLSVPSPATAHRTLKPAPQHKRSVSMTSLPVYNQQVADSCIVRVSVENGNNGNMYKSILLTSQDKTAQVIQRALEKHNLEDVNCQDFTLSQVLPQDRELLIPEKTNVFYAMSTSANYDFVLRQQKSSPRKPLGSTSSLSSYVGGRHAK